MDTPTLIICEARSGRGRTTATVKPGTRLAAIVESLAGKSLLPHELVKLDPPSFDHVALCLQAHGVVLKGDTLLAFTMVETRAEAAGV